MVLSVYMTQTDSEAMPIDPRAQALLRKIDAFLDRQQREREPISEHRFLTDMRYPQLLHRLRNGAGVSYSVQQRVEEYIKARGNRRARK